MNNVVDFYIHFDGVDDKHEIHSQSLLVFLEAHHKIAKHFGINTDIKIGTPEQGGWGANIIMTVSFIGSLSPLFSLITGKSLDEWGKNGHDKITKATEVVNEFIITKPSEIPDGELTDELKECIEQKNKIYTQFLKDPCINSFDLDKHPSIPRNNFQLYIKELPDEKSIYLGKTDITVSSPDWKGKRTWRGNIQILEDDKDNSYNFNKNLTGRFWEKIELDGLLLHTKDTMNVQLIKRPEEQVKYQVIRVLSYNNQKIDKELLDNDIEKIAILNNNKKTTENPQPDLFPANNLG